MDRTVYVGNITASITEETLRALFTHCGQVTGVRISGDPTYNARFGFVEFLEQGMAHTAVMLNGLTLADRSLRVSMAKTGITRPAGGGTTVMSPMGMPISSKPNNDPNRVARTVHIAGVDPQVTEQHLQQYFAVCGEVVAVRVSGDGIHQNRFGWVEFASIEAAAAALQLNDQTLGKQALRINPSKSAIQSNGLAPRPSMPNMPPMGMHGYPPPLGGMPPPHMGMMGGPGLPPTHMMGGPPPGPPLMPGMGGGLAPRGPPPMGGGPLPGPPSLPPKPVASADATGDHGEEAITVAEGCVVLVANVDVTQTDADLRALFQAACGTVRAVTLLGGGKAEVAFDSPTGAQAALVLEGTAFTVTLKDPAVQAAVPAPEVESATHGDTQAEGSAAAALKVEVALETTEEAATAGSRKREASPAAEDDTAEEGKRTKLVA